MRKSIKVRLEDKRDEFIKMIAFYEGEMTEADYQQVMEPFMSKDDDFIIGDYEDNSDEKK